MAHDIFRSDPLDHQSLRRFLEQYERRSTDIESGRRRVRLAAAQRAVICPPYSGQPRRELRRLAAGVEQPVRRLRDHDISISELPTVTVASALEALQGLTGRDPLLVYVGGHGIVVGRDHFTALDRTPAPDGTPPGPNSFKPAPRPELLQTGPPAHPLHWPPGALWTRQLAQRLASARRDVVLVVDSCR
jgi:hypothetical protein